MRKVFIRHTREDPKIARRLYDDLKNAGVKPWMDKLGLLPGQRWKPAIRSAVKDSQYFLLLLSSASVTKQGFVHKEMRIGIKILDELPG